MALKLSNKDLGKAKELFGGLVPKILQNFSSFSECSVEAGEFCPTNVHVPLYAKSPSGQHTVHIALVEDGGAYGFEIAGGVYSTKRPLKLTQLHGSTQKEAEEISRSITTHYFKRKN